jgi:hypothetical protein
MQRRGPGLRPGRGILKTLVPVNVDTKQASVTADSRTITSLRVDMSKMVIARNCRDANR